MELRSNKRLLLWRQGVMTCASGARPAAAKVHRKSDEKCAGSAYLIVTYTHYPENK